MTVLVTTDRTDTGRTTALRGDSRYRKVSIDQSAGENGESAEVAMLLGVSPAGEHNGDAGMRKRRRDLGPELVRRRG